MTAEHRDEFFEALTAIAAATPHAEAIVEGEASSSYADVVAEIAALAAALVDGGLRIGDRVAIVAENSAAFLTSAFAVWAAGGVLVTIYPSSSIEDMAYCLTQSDPALVLTDRATADTVAEAIRGAVPTVRIDAAFVVDSVRRGTAANPPDLRAPLHLICYTSGTTSRPKAIMISADGLIGGIRAYSGMWRLGPADRTIVCLPMAWLFGLATTSMATLLAGGTVLVLRRSHPELIVDVIERQRATFFCGVTTMYAKLVDHLDSLVQPPDLSSLRFCISGGEPRNEAAFDRWTRHGGRPVLDTFCASECFPLITYDPVADPVPVRGSAGKLVPECRLRVVDEQGRDVAPGEVGEAIATGPGLFLGYWGDPEQTDAAFTPEGWYRQRDLVRVDPDGYVYVVGRLSDMIIRGGANVSPAEVERVLREQPGVKDVCVVGMPDAVFGQQVVAAVVADPVIDLDALDAATRARLAAYKVPSAYHLLDRLPLNSTTGKVDRKAVAAAIAPPHVTAATAPNPRNEP
jgi:long-chain acyl-CoA synthetase